MKSRGGWGGLGRAASRTEYITRIGSRNLRFCLCSSSEPLIPVLVKLAFVQIQPYSLLN